MLVDLPGVQRPRDALTERMQRRVERELADSDAALFVVNGEQGVGPGDRFIADDAARRRRAGRDRRQQGRPPATAPHTSRRCRGRRELGVAEDDLPDLRPHRARASGPLREHLAGAAARGAVPVPARGALRPARGRHARRARARAGAAPHASRRCRTRSRSRSRRSTSRGDDLTVVRALVWVETESQKGILIGSGGRMIKAIGTAARKELERELGGRVHLDLSVRVRRGWRGDERCWTGSGSSRRGFVVAPAPAGPASTRGGPAALRHAGGLRTGGGAVAGARGPCGASTGRVASAIRPKAAQPPSPQHRRRLDLHQLALVPEQRDAEQRRRGRGVGRRLDGVPRHAEVRAVGRHDVHRRPHHVRRAAPPAPPARP